MSAYVNLNGKILASEEVCISPNNRSFKYGDGFFDTMRFHSGKIVLATFHAERIQNSLERLQFEPGVFPDTDIFERQVKQLTSENGHTCARIRCTVFRGDGALYDNVDSRPNYLIQSWNLPAENNYLNKEGLDLGIYTNARKVADEFSSVKSNNFLAYVMAALHVKKTGIDDCLLLNTLGNIADSTIANIFLVKNGVVTTPPLSEGPVSGVMRRYLLMCLNVHGIPLNEVPVTITELMDADEVFLTNAIYGIRWVKSIAGSGYSSGMSSYLHEKLVKPLFTPF